MPELAAVMFDQTMLEVSTVIGESVVCFPTVSLFVVPSDTNPTAIADRNSTSTSGGASVAPSAAAPASNAQGAAQQPLEAVGSVTDLGDLGDLATSSELNRVRNAFSAAKAAANAANAESKTTADSSTRAASLLSELRASPCASQLPEGTIVALGRARFGTEDAIVVQTQRPDGSFSLDAVVADPCEVRPLD